MISSNESEQSVKRHFRLAVNKLCDSNFHTQETPKTNTTDQSSLNLSEDCFATEYLLDTICSGESLIKRFSFDTSKYNSDTDKCVEFWKMLKKEKIRPVTCTLIKHSNNIKKENKTNVMDTEEQAGESDTDMWLKALVELLQKKMDEVAFVVTGTNCNFCKQEEPYIEFKRKLLRKRSPKKLKDKDDITCLNNWNPELRTINIDTAKMLPITNKEGLAQTSLQQLEVEEKQQSSTQIYDSMSVQQSEGVKELRSSTQLDNLLSKKCPCDNKLCCPDLLKSEKAGLSYFEEILEKAIMMEYDTITSTIAATVDKIQKAESDQCTTNDCVEKIDKAHIKHFSCVISEECLKHKIKLSKKYLDDLRYEMQCNKLREDKASPSEEVEEIYCSKEFCIICGHNDCNCRSKTITSSHLESDESEHISEQNQKCFEVNTPCLHNEKETILMNNEKLENNACCKMKLGDVESLLHAKSITEGKHKKLFITPALRAKQALSNKTHIYEIDRYGIPQVLKYSDGRNGPKRITSKDISVSSLENLNL